jgi:hypothetical protein
MKKNLVCILSYFLFFLSSAALAQTQRWIDGPSPANQPVPDQMVNPLNIELGGYPFMKSDNPEIFFSAGWLMNHSRVDSQRGGARYPVNGCTNSYMFHINKVGRKAFLHLLVTNASNAPIRLSAKGSLYTNSQKIFKGKASGPSYMVSRDWLYGSFATKFSNRPVNALATTEVVKVQMNELNMADGRFEVCATGPVFLTTVATLNGTLNEAISAMQGAPDVGDIQKANVNDYSRDAGIYASSVVGGLTVVPLPSTTAHTAFAFNTTGTFNSGLQEQTSPALMRMNDSNTRTFANFGHKFDITLRLFNPHAWSRTVRLYLASSYTNQINDPIFTFNSPGMLNGMEMPLFTTPTQPKQILATWTLRPNQTFDARLVTFIAGLVVTNQQLIVEVLP